CPLDLGGDGCDGVLVAAVDRNQGALAREQLGDGGADAARASGHQGDTALQVTHGAHLLRWVRRAWARSSCTLRLAVGSWAVGRGVRDLGRGCRPGTVPTVPCRWLGR